MRDLFVLELCAGAGGQALGLENAGFDHVGLVEIDKSACQTLRLNRPGWNIIEDDIKNVDGKQFKGVDLVAGGLPCPPFSIAGRQLGAEDERDLFPQALRIIGEARPAAIMIENVPGFASKRFDSYRENIVNQLHDLGYDVDWKILKAEDFGVPQHRPRFVLLGLKRSMNSTFHWPEIRQVRPVTVSQSIFDLMSANGWLGVNHWSQKADKIAPTLVGGSKKHGGPDLGPTRAKKQWGMLGVDGHGIADEPPSCDFPVDANPRLTTRMTARIQAFPDSWVFSGRKTNVYRQIGNAFPPLVAGSVGFALVRALNNCDKSGDVIELSCRMA